MRVVRWAAVAAGVVALVVFGRSLAGYVPRFAEWIAGLGAWGPAAFIAGYAAAAVAFVPGSLLTLAAGAVFGLVRGTVYTLLGATLGASLAFLVSRYLVRRTVERRVQSDPRFVAIDQAVAREGRKIVFLLRLSPVLPFNLLNYALGVTRVRFVDHLVGCVGMLPGTLLYVYYGKLAGDVAGAVSGGGARRGAGYYVVLGLGLVATLVVSLFIARLARRALTANAPDGLSAGI